MYLSIRRIILYTHTYFIVVTKYELAEWEGFYLRLWAKNEIQLDYVSAEDFLKEISVSTVPLFINYFSISSIINGLFIYV